MRGDRHINFTMNTKKTSGIIFLGLSVVLFSVFYFGNRPIDLARSFSNYQMLQNIWSNYKKTYVDASGKTTDPTSTQGNDVTTSEGQSYTMLRAVWLGDKDTFDKSFTWTQHNMQEKNGYLFSWL